MSRNRFFDESKIIKKDEPIIEEVIHENLEIKEEIINLPENVIVTEDNIDLNNKNNIEYKVNDTSVINSQQYLEVVNKYKQQLNEQNNKEEEKKPIYNYSKNIESGEIIIETKKPTVIIQDKIETKEEELKLSNLSNYDIEIKKLIEKAEIDLIRTNIELKIHFELIRTENDLATKKLYESRIETFKRDINYFNKRLLILKNMPSK